MKSPLGKLRQLAALRRGDLKENSEFQPPGHAEELAQAAQDMQHLKNCYDSLLSAAAATANSAYEFSESLQEMGACLQQNNALNDDVKTSRALFMLGRVQFELQKLVDSYRSHIFLTITNPSESLLNELRTVEEMKRQCDEKRSVYEYMMAQRRLKGRSKCGKKETFTAQQLQTARNEYEEEATLCVFRLKSLKQGQSRSLLTQAARHHAAQLNFYRKGLKSLEAVEPHVSMVTEQQHIDYHFAGLEEDGGEVGEYDSENDNDTDDDGELSFDYIDNKQGLEVVSTSRNSMELEQSDVSFHQATTFDYAEVIPTNSHGELQDYSRGLKVGSHSAPIFAEKKIDPADKITQMKPLSSRKSQAYVLPTPVLAKTSNRTSFSDPCTRLMDQRGHNHKLSLSPPFSKGPSVLPDRNSKNASIRPPASPMEDHRPPQMDLHNIYGSKKIKRQAFSGPLAVKPSPSKSVSSSSGPIGSAEVPQLSSGFPFPRVSTMLSSSPKVSPSASPPLTSSPRINELHELPRPPGLLIMNTAKSPHLTGHSAPLVYKSQEPSTAKNIFPVVPSAASPLPTPPSAVGRSFSVPPSCDQGTELHVAGLLEGPQIASKSFERVASPPLTSTSPF